MNDSGAGERLPESPVSILVMGLGSVLMGDDAVGPWFTRWLESHWELPSGVSVLDAGTPGPELFQYLEGFDALVVVDTVHADAPAGTVRRYGREQVMRMPAQPRTSPHNPSLREALLTVDLVGRAPREVLLIGVVPERVSLPAGLSGAVLAAMPEVERAVVAELGRLGARVRRRPQPTPLGVWWETGTDVAVAPLAAG